MVLNCSRLRSYTSKTRTAFEKKGMSYTMLRTLDSCTPWNPKRKWENELLDLYRGYHSTDLHKYNCDKDPFELVYVDPQKISKITGIKRPSEVTLIGDVTGGEWDQSGVFRNTENPHLYRGEEFEDVLLYQSLKERFINGIKWEKTEFIQEVLQLIENGRAVWHNCRSAKDVMSRCDKIDNLYHNIRSSGYIPYRELKGGIDHFLLRLYTNEILFDVDRSGELLIADGFHRLSIAKILELDQIPALLRVRHQRAMEDMSESSI